MTYHKQVRVISPETCPWIDNIIRHLEDAESYAQFKGSDNIEELQEKLTNVYDALNRRANVHNIYAGTSPNWENVYGIIELVRKANDSIRTYACELLEKNEEHEETISQNETTIAELREQVKELQSEKRELENQMFRLQDA